MFNGIIFNQGTVTKITKRSKGINLFIKSDLKLNKNNTVIFYNNANKTKIALFKKKGIKLVKSNLMKNDYFDFKSILKKLYNLGCRNLLVEGGNDLSKNILQNKLFNQFYVFQSQKNLSKLVTYKDFNCFKYLSQNYKSRSKINTMLGNDLITLYKR